MRLSDYLGCQVLDADGVRLGRVLDAHLVADGAPCGAFGRSLRMHELIVGRGSLGARLGLDRSRVDGPWLLKTLFSRRRLRRVPWDAIGGVEHRIIRLTVRANELGDPRAAIS
jgi:hypothetical protein